MEAKESKCHRFSTVTLNIINALLLILACIFLSYSVYLSSSFIPLHYDIIETISTTGTTIGAIMFLVSLAGLIGTFAKEKCCIMTYVICSGCVSFVMVIVGIILIVSGTIFGDVAQWEIDYKNKTGYSEVKDFGLVLYQACCVEEFNATEIGPCPAGENHLDCFLFNNITFQNFVNEIEPELCHDLGYLIVDETSLVGDFEFNEGSCGGGEAAPFIVDIGEYMEDVLIQLGSVGTTISIVMFIGVILSILFLCTTHRTYEVKVVKVMTTPMARYRSRRDIQKQDSEATDEPVKDTNDAPYPETSGPEPVQGDSTHFHEVSKS